MAEMKKGQRGIDAARKVMPVGLGVRAVGARVAGKVAGRALAKSNLAQAARRSVGNLRKKELERHAAFLYKVGIQRTAPAAKRGFMKASGAARKLAGKL